MKRILAFAVLLAVSVSRCIAARPEPQPQIDEFFKDLSEQGASTAMKELCAGSLLEAQKGVQLESWAAQIDTVIKLYGKVSRTENVDKKAFGQSFVRHRLISYHATGAPLFWEFMFFRAKEDWQIYVFRFNDQFYRVFSDTP